jgi:hypothetical protein
MLPLQWLLTCYRWWIKLGIQTNTNQQRCKPSRSQWFEHE